MHCFRPWACPFLEVKGVCGLHTWSSAACRHVGPCWVTKPKRTWTLYSLVRTRSHEGKTSRFQSGTSYPVQRHHVPRASSCPSLHPLPTHCCNLKYPKTQPQHIHEREHRLRPIPFPTTSFLAIRPLARSLTTPHTRSVLPPSLLLYRQGRTSQSWHHHSSTHSRSENCPPVPRGH